MLKKLTGGQDDEYIRTMQTRYHNQPDKYSPNHHATTKLCNTVLRITSNESNYIKGRVRHHYGNAYGRVCSDMVAGYIVLTTPPPPVRYYAAPAHHQAHITPAILS